MEIRHRILQFINSPKYNILKSELDKIGTKYKIHPNGDLTSLEFIISEDSPIYIEHIKKLVEEHDLYVQTGVYFSKKDLKQAQRLWVAVSESQYPQPEEGGGYKTATYDTSNYCVRCGMGALQNQPFRLVRDFTQKRDVFFGLHWVFDEVFLRPEAKLVLEREGITGITFSHPVYHRSGKEMTTVFQMRIEETIQVGLVTKELSTVTCKENNEEWKFAGARKNVAGYPFCGRVKYHHPRRSPITFKKEAFGKLPDVVKSQEYFGSGIGAHKLIVVSRKFTEVIAKHKLRGMRLRPVKLI